MPFPLAHPAAVLPLKRFCPRFLSFPALVVGTLVPDAGYVLKRYHVEEFSHSLPGLLGFALPVGLPVMWLLYRFRSQLLRLAPARLQGIGSRFCGLPLPSFSAVVVSILMGAGTHLVWDSFTHRDGWLVERVAFLQFPLLVLGHRTVKVCHLLWYLSTFVGVASLMMAGLGALDASKERLSACRVRTRLGQSLLFAGLMVPVATAHHLIGGLPADFLLLLCSALLSLGCALWLGKTAGQGT
jgi:hypothetical protein